MKSDLVEISSDFVKISSDFVYIVFYVIVFYVIVLLTNNKYCLVDLIKRGKYGSADISGWKTTNQE